jgi:hypothetical protein
MRGASEHHVTEAVRDVLAPGLREQVGDISDAACRRHGDELQPVRIARHTHGIEDEAEFDIVLAHQ